MDAKKSKLSPLKLKMVTEICRSWSSQNRKRKGITTDELAIKLVEENLTKLRIGSILKELKDEGLVVVKGYYKRYFVYGVTEEGAKFVDFECVTHLVQEEESSCESSK